MLRLGETLRKPRLLTLCNKLDFLRTKKENIIDEKIDHIPPYANEGTISCLLVVKSYYCQLEPTHHIYKLVQKIRPQSGELIDMHMLWSLSVKMYHMLRKLTSNCPQVF